SEAVGQVEGDFDVEVVALNLDDLTPSDTILSVRTKMEMENFLQKHTDDFLVRHERHPASTLHRVGFFQPMSQ
ncbi:MAG: hypothetical protein ABIU05_17440, partial [Nitrospirales bacterium]